jgi:hypothetical protein
MLLIAMIIKKNKNIKNNSIKVKEYVFVGVDGNSKGKV